MAGGTEGVSGPVLAPPVLKAQGRRPTNFLLNAYISSTAKTSLFTFAMQPNLNQSSLVRATG